MTKITIEQLTDVYQITCGDYKAIIHGNSNLQKEIESLFENTDLSQKGQDTPDIQGPVYHNEDNEIKDPDKSINVKNELPTPQPVVDIPPAPTDQETETGDMIEFHELNMSMPKHMLEKLYGARRNTDKHNLTYYSNEDGGLIIQYGTNRCYTTWNDLHKLPHPVPGEMLTKLNSQKKLGVKAFKEWMVRQAEMSKTEDLDKDFRPMLSGVIDTSTNYDGSKLDGVD